MDRWETFGWRVGDWCARAGSLAIVSLAWLLTAFLGQAQAFEQIPQPSDTTEPHTNAASLVTEDGHYRFKTLEVSIGQPDAGGLVYERTWLHVGWRDNLTGMINSSGSIYTVTIGAISQTFTLASGVFTHDQRMGSTLTYNSTTGIYTYTDRNGAVALFSKALAGTSPLKANEGRIISLADPTGETLTFTYKTVIVCMGSPCVNTMVARLQSAETNLGYQLRLQYSLNSQPAENQISDWTNITKVTGVDLGTFYCDRAADTCAGISTLLPSATYGGTATSQTVTDQSGRVTRYTLDGASHITGVKRPSSSTDNIAITYIGDRIDFISDGVGTWTYQYTDGFSGRNIVSITDPSSVEQTYQIGADTGLLLRQSFGNETIFYGYDSYGRIDGREHSATGEDVQLSYDDRGNVTQVTKVLKFGSSVSDIVTSSSFSADCVNPVTCNKPNSTADERGSVTNYTYDPIHGGVLTVTRPAPTTGAARPQLSYSYTPLYAWYKDGSGLVVQASKPIYRLTATAACATATSCAGSANEVKSTIGYGTAGVANHLLPVSMSTGSGNGVLTATTTATYDDVGNRLTVDGPLAGSGDTTRYRYDGSRHLVGVVMPDADAAGPLKYRAVRVTYNADDQPTLVELGTVNSQSDLDWAAFSVLEQHTIAYNAQGRTKTEALIAGGSTRTVTQYSYDNAGRSECVAVRMNPAVFGSLPPSACTLGTTGANGPDRITKTTYDPKGRQNKTIRGYATAAPLDEVTITYTALSLPETVTDANGNMTTYEYDGFGRLSKVRFPSPAAPGTSSTTDYEQYSYDAASNVTQDTRRDGEVISYTYDTLNRRSAWTGSITYTYDNLDRPTSAVSSQTDSFTWDALNRLTSATTPLGTVSYQYDLAGNRTRVTWPDAFYVAYDYDLSGAMTAARENGATSGVGVLATFAYDNLGRRTSLTRGNGVVTTYSWDAASRLTSLGLDLAGTGSDQTWTFGWNPAFQIQSRTGTNVAYDFPAPSAATTVNTANGLNQLATVAGVTMSYDANGDLSNDGAKIYGYSVDGLMISVTGATMTNDALRRLYQTQANGGAATRFLYDADEIIAEYSGSSLLRRYVRGPGTDEALVWYEGSGTSDRRWLVADERGSVVAVADATGASTAINTYDEYGNPGTANLGRFQYTGQAWIPEVELYHYKARAYSPTLGRFMQPDPIGYGDGMNIYAYAQNDPVNFTDPSGLEACPDGRPDCTVKFVEVTANRIDEGIPIIGDVAATLSSRGVANTIREVIVTAQKKVNEVTSVSLSLIPGYDLLQCTSATCTDVNGNLNPTGWWAVVGLIPEGKFLKEARGGRSLAEELAIQESKNNPAAERIMADKINDARFPADKFAKMQYVHQSSGGNGNIVVHFWRNLETGAEFGFKVK